MFAIDPSRLNVEPRPFAHMVIDGLFDPATFAALDARYPACPPASGPTGRTIHRGDAQFEAVMDGSPEWRAFFGYSNSEEFTDLLASLFAEEIRRSCRVDAFRHVDHIESRADKERTQTQAPIHPREAVFTRFDFMQGMDSYTRAPHLDHRRRLATLLLYFDAPGPETFSGGDLVLHDAAGTPVTRIAPAANRAVLFPCSERSWHSVEAVRDCRHPRRFMQIALSSCHDLWPDARLPDANVLAWGKRVLRSLLPA